jgi:hypothetical protein
MFANLITLATAVAVIATSGGVAAALVAKRQHEPQRIVSDPPCQLDHQIRVLASKATRNLRDLSAIHPSAGPHL